MGWQRVRHDWATELNWMYFKKATSRKRHYMLSKRWIFSIKIVYLGTKKIDSLKMPFRCHWTCPLLSTWEPNQELDHDLSLFSPLCIPSYQVEQWERICLPIQVTFVQSLGQEDFLEEEMAAHSSILAWKIPWTEEPGEWQSRGLQRVRQDWALSTG